MSHASILRDYWVCCYISSVLPYAFHYFFTGKNYQNKIIYGIQTPRVLRGICIKALFILRKPNYECKPQSRISSVFRIIQRFCCHGNLQVRWMREIARYGQSGGVIERAKTLSIIGDYEGEEECFFAILFSAMFLCNTLQIACISSRQY